MAVTTTNDLKRILFDAYDGFADKRLKNLDKGTLFVFDDRNEQGDYDARGDIFLWFCQMLVEVQDATTVTITLRGGVPNSARVREVLDGVAAKEAPFGTQFTISIGKEGVLRELAAAFKAIVRPGAKYPVKSYKYVCPRAAASLRKLADVLQAAWA